MKAEVFQIFSVPTGVVLCSKDRNYVRSKERHDVGRPDDQGYPVRGIVKDGFLYLRNFKPDRWPAGNPETGYLNTDAGPTKTLILNMKRSNRSDNFWNLNFGKRTEEELYNIMLDPGCISNLAGQPEFIEVATTLGTLLEEDLIRQNDPRIIGNGDIFDNYPYAEEHYERFL